MSKSSINIKSEEIRKDQSSKSIGKSTKKFNTNFNTKTTKSLSIQKAVDTNKSNINNRKNTINTNVNTSKSNTTVKQVADLETRASLQQKMKCLEEELQRYDLERSRITQELDRVCEEKDIEIRHLKTELNEKQLEIDQQMSSYRRHRNEFEEELNKFKADIEDMKLEFCAKESLLLANNQSLEKQLSDLNDYIRNKEQTLDKIRELEELVKQQNVFHKRVKDKLIGEVQNEKLKVEELVSERVNQIRKGLETSCLNKLAIDARIALQKFEEMSKNYEMCEQECRHLRLNNQTLKTTLRNRTIHLEVSESLLHQMLKELNRKLRNRKHIAIQCQA